jgi:hypothetical protein
VENMPLPGSKKGSPNLVGLVNLGYFLIDPNVLEYGGS